MMDIIKAIAIIEFVLLALLYVKSTFKIMYYEQKLKNAGIPDTVKNITFFQILRL